MFFLIIGVTDIQTDVAAKTVVVTAADSVDPQEMLSKLLKVSTVADALYCI